MIRVGLRLRDGLWQGGRNYLWNLAYAVGKVPQPSIACTLVARRDICAEFSPIPALTQCSPPWPCETRAAATLARVGRRVFHNSVVEDVLARHCRIDLWSHVGLLGRRNRTPFLFWLADLQHRRLPAMFSSAERAARDRQFLEAFRSARLVIVSSEVTLRDVQQFYGAGAASRCRVLHFVAQPRVEHYHSLSVLRARYPVLPERYYFLPNQFWKHKNHAVVIEALAALRDTQIAVVATGPTDDYRHPGHFDSLMSRVANAGLTGRFIPLGLVPHDVVMSIMRHAHAVLNPSLFEGWSTTVEEAKALGKPLLVSDIAAHREQLPSGGVFFAPDDSEGLARLLRASWEVAPGADHAAAEHEARTVDFGRTFQGIVVEACRRS